jgi:SAM-dependent methyltransferase
MTELRKQFGDIDIYLFDQILRGRILPGMRILDAGCGLGRNLVYLLREGYEVYAVDHDASSVQAVRSLAHQLAPRLPAGNFRAESIEAMSFADGFADVAISNAVLHFARDDRQFQEMLRGTWRTLKAGGLLFCRLASSIGVERQIRHLTGRRFELPDGSERYLVDEEMLTKAAKDLLGRMIDPLKTTVVQNERAMTTWVLRKNDG